MSTLDGSIKSLLGGMSQQVPQERLAGQVGYQLNMVSDIVTGLRRRTGVRFGTSIGGVAADPTTTYSMFYEGAGRFNVLISASTGTVRVLNEDCTTVLGSVQHAYLIAPAASNLRTTALSGVSWLLNTAKKPSLVYSAGTKIDPARSGFFWVKLGAFNKTYTMTVRAFGVTTTATYTTPDASAGGSAAASTPEAIALALRNSLATSLPSWMFTAVGAYVYILTAGTSGEGLLVQSLVGTSFVQVSFAMQVALSSDLPALVPATFEGLLCSVGTSKALTYFRWLSARGIWVESSVYTSHTTINNCPIKLTISALGVPTLDTSAFEGRLAGDVLNNPDHSWVTDGITGIASFQGRLVLLSGGTASMSASGNPKRFYRSTVTDIRDDDPIEVGSGSTSSAAFEYAIPFNQDLVVIAAGMQAVIPAASLLTSRNARLNITSSQRIDTQATPIVVGKTLMYASAQSPEFYAVGELVPSDTAASQYTPQNLTEHIPRFLSGRCRHLVGAAACSMLLATSTTNLHALYVYEFIWSGNDRGQMAWHKWTMPQPIASVHYANDKFVIILAGGDGSAVCTINTKTSAYTESLDKVPYLDMYTPLTFSMADGRFVLPAHLSNADPRLLSVCVAAGAEANEPVGIADFDFASQVGHIDASWYENGGGKLYVGYKYLSVFEPTPPMVKDRDNNVITSVKTTLVRYKVTTKDTGAFMVSVTNRKLVSTDSDASAMLWSSVELGLGQVKTTVLGVVTIPVRSTVMDTVVQLYTDGTRNMGILGMEYTMRHVLPRGRMF